MIAPEYLYKVDESGVLRIFQVTLGYGTYVNVRCLDSGELLTMQNRFNCFRDTPEKAWACRATTLQRALIKARDTAKVGLRRLAMLNRIRTEYSRKQDDIKSAEDRVWTDLTGLIRMQNAANDALALAGITTTPETDATTNTSPAP